MKCKIIALGFVAYSAAAFPQSSVTLYGALDEGVDYINNVSHVVNGVKVGSPQYALDSLAGPWGSRWGIKGTEDLGGGLHTIFTLESGINVNTGGMAQGGLLFGRQAFVGISQEHFGTVTLGRQYDSVNDYVSQFGPLDPWGSGANHPGDMDNLTRDYRLNNTLKYASPNWGGLTFGGTVTAGGVAGEITQNSGYTLGVEYTHGYFSTGVAYEFEKNPSSVGGVLNNGGSAVTPANSHAFGSVNAGYLATANPASSWQDIVAGASYLFGRYTLAGTYSNVRYGNIGSLGGASATFNIFDINGRIQINPALFAGLSYSYTKGNAVKGDLGDQAYNQFSIIVDESLSKRTDIYAACTYQTASGTNSLGQSAVANVDQFGDSATNHQVLVRLAIRQIF
ncbi:porin [Paraburkholderia sp. BCC1885]|uniref:porin n=1 Tax=Paraburkholderia sp. BCC1885 TaxID=2562669 RepID=UPI0011821EFD|nr:porin [Paraburkholderia sp. BCC1885]